MTSHVHLRFAALGLALGFVLSQAGFSDFGEVHRMFTLGLVSGGPTTGDLRLLLGFCGAVALAAAGFFLLARRDALPPRKLHPGVVPGGLLFGAGWALAGGCPSIALVQLGEGRAIALATVAGVFAGSWACRRLRVAIGWDNGSCTE